MNLAAVTNAELARALDVHESHVSRLRSGRRGPSLVLMVKLETLLEWGIRDQVLAQLAGLDSYANQLEEYLRKTYGVTPNA